MITVKEAYKKVDAAYKVVRSLRDKSETPAYGMLPGTYTVLQCKKKTHN